MNTREAFTTRAPANPPAAATESADARDFAIEAARLLADSHCDDVVIFDVSELSPVTRMVLIATGTSDRQIKSLIGHLTDLGKEMGFDRFGSERDDASTWMVADFVEVMVHLFEPGTRAHYDLEMLWGDAPRVSWHRG
jgi:ribosome-associated protein